jgi:16S rRNA G966 N2-methylase RsmD
VEKDPIMFDFIRKTATGLGMQNTTFVKSDVFRFIDQCADKFNLIFAGPPYALTNIDDLPLRIFQKDLLLPGGWFILEHTPRNDYKTFAGYRSERKYGTTIFSIFRRTEE